MIGEPAMQLPEELSKLARAVRGELERTLSHRFSIWSNQESWQFMPDADFSSEQSALCEPIKQYLEQQEFHQDSVTRLLENGQQLLMVPVSGPRGGQLLVVGFFGPHAPEIVCALADAIVASLKTSLELQDTTQLLDQYVVQITSNFEELTWLRSLAEHFEICDLRNGLAHVGRATLSSLRLLIDAQVLLLFGMPKSLENTASPGRECPVLAYDGDLGELKDFASHLIVDLESSFHGQTVVWNLPNSTAIDARENKIRNYVLTPVTKSKEQLGWLLAINKMCSTVDQNGVDLHGYDRNLLEFGTGEAGLMSTMAIMLATHGRNVELLHDKEALLVGVIRALINAIDAKDAYTSGHSDRVALMSKRIAQQLGMSDAECERIHMTGLLHDIGKIGVPDSVLGKPGKLTVEEFEMVKMHPEIGVAILKHLEPLAYVLPGVLYHHESIDGRGYPHGLKGNQIPLVGRIIAVADSYDAMTSDRPYRKGMPTKQAESILRSGAGTQWDCEVIESFFAALPDIYTICGTGESVTKNHDSPIPFGSALALRTDATALISGWPAVVAH